MFCMKKSFERINRKQVAMKGYVFIRSYTSSSLRTGAERKLEEDPLPLPSSSTDLLPVGSAACLPCLLILEEEKCSLLILPDAVAKDKTCLLRSYTVTR